ncbi:DUF2934 domain-containing protein [Roseospira visakhapatnamensis]|uniref:DUF2934 domain-containing protein n=1 Tax=Roseospira visakhapatnamensis TaxID=390880 RepID=A0A7W6RBC2_9PROT|nr:DUF2934 domain-containing protein [Roseospira visakhapatnamensis]MBB4265359.1 hypothetical protein [Roseospira visakhapatnamensis]
MTMQNDLLERIRSRAYELWLEEGQPLGRDEDHWARAEAEVLANEATAGADSAAPKPKTTRRRTTKAADATAEGDDAAKPKRTRRTTKAKTEADAESADATAAKPKRTARRKKTED